MILFRDLFFDFDVVQGGELLGEPCSALIVDSRQTVAGSVFVAQKGTRFDSHDVLAQVIADGVGALVVSDLQKVPSSFGGIVVRVNSPRAALATLSARFYNLPSRELFCCGVTGTNGKTSITYLLEHIFNVHNRPTGVIGTINHHLLGQIWPTEMTTSSPIELQHRLRQFCDAGARALAIEVSSHALDQHRADSLEFDVAVFTNLTRDHLDYHQSMESYFLAKQRFFTDLLEHSVKKNKFAIINSDDSWGAKMKCTTSATRWTYGQNSKDFRFKVNSMDFSQTRFALESPFGSVDVELPMAGLHNAYNATAAIAVGCSAGLDIKSIAMALRDFSGVPGRLQRVSNQKGINVFIDYAHTPDALENSLRSLRDMKRLAAYPGKLWTVFGCGGDRDRGKRPEMAKVAEKYSDQIVVTSDNPRSESPEAIIAEICLGFTRPGAVIQITDRSLAIEHSIAGANPGDVILIAGKGHEDYQIIGKEKFYFSDYEKAKEALDKRL